MDPEIGPQLFTYGPLGIGLSIALWYIGVLLKDKKDVESYYRDKLEKIETAHKVEIAAERSLNARLQEDRLTDQKTLIPLGNAMVAAVELLDDERKSAR